jgi:hypothetical protein
MIVKGGSLRKSDTFTGKIYDELKVKGVFDLL